MRTGKAAAKARRSAVERSTRVPRKTAATEMTPAAVASAVLRKHRNSKPAYQQRKRGEPLHKGILLPS